MIASQLSVNFAQGAQNTKDMDTACQMLINLYRILRGQNQLVTKIPFENMSSQLGKAYTKLDKYARMKYNDILQKNNFEQKCNKLEKQESLYQEQIQQLEEQIKKLHKKLNKKQNFSSEQTPYQEQMVTPYQYKQDLTNSNYQVLTSRLKQQTSEEYLKRRENKMKEESILENSKHHKLRTELESKEIAFEGMEKLLKSTKKQNQEFKEEYIKMNKRITELVRQLQDYKDTQKKYRNLFEENQLLKTQFQEFNLERIDQKNKLKNQIEGKDQEIQFKSRQICQLKEIFAQKQEEIKKQIKSHQNVIKELIDKYENMIKEKQDKISKANQQFKGLKDNFMNEIENQKIKYQKLIKEENQKYLKAQNSLQQKSKMFEIAEKQLNARLNQLQLKFTVKSDQFFKQKQQIQAYCLQTVSLNDTIRQLQQRNISQKQDHDQFYEGLRQQFITLNEQNKLKIKSIEEKDHQIKGLKTTVEEKLNFIQVLTKQIQLKNKESVLEYHINQNTETIDRLTKQNQSLKITISEMEKIRQKLEQTNKCLEKKIQDNDRIKFNRLIHENGALREELYNIILFISKNLERINIICQIPVEEEYVSNQREQIQQIQNQIKGISKKVETFATQLNNICIEIEKNIKRSVDLTKLLQQAKQIQNVRIEANLKQKEKQKIQREEEIQRFKSQLQRQQQQNHIKDQKEETSDYIEQIRQLKQQLKKKQKEIQSIDEKPDEETSRQLLKRINARDDLIKKYQNDEYELKRQIKTLKETNAKASSQNGNNKNTTELQQKITKLEGVRKKLVQQNCEYSQQIKDLKQALKKYKEEEEVNEIKRNRLQNRQNGSNNSQKRSFTDELIKPLQDKVKYLQDKLYKYSKMQVKMQNRMNPFLSLQYQHIFQGDIFQYDYISKQILVKHIKNFHKGQQIIATKLLYKLDKYNIVNFHTYIDYRTRIVMIVKTNNAIMAGYYPGMLTDKAAMDEQGIIMSINNDMAYQLVEKTTENKQPKAVVYDGYYMIYGNAELRVTAGENKVYSNFGILNSFYNPFVNNVRKTVNDFLCEGQSKEAQLITYEFHKVFLDQKEITYDLNEEKEARRLVDQREKSKEKK